MNKFVKTKIKLKHNAWIKYKRSHLSSEHSIYVQYRNECTAAVRRAKYDFENNLTNGIKVNPKRFWKYATSQTKVKHTGGGLLKSDSSITVDDNDIANTLNKFFASDFTQENAMEVPSFRAWHSGSSLSAISITAEDVWKQLCGLKVHKSSGPDNFHHRVYWN